MHPLKDIGHLFRFVALFVVGTLAILGLRAWLTPRSFGQYGHYRGAALDDIAAHPIHFAGHQTCETCHADVAEMKGKGKHAHVNCEACHGAQNKHAEDFTSGSGTIKPVLPDTAVLCGRCHAASAARPKTFPQVNIDEHSNGVPCQTCHQPHSPAIGSGDAK